MRVLVTRVQPQADSWVKQLAGHYDALALPLIEVGPVHYPQVVRDVGQRWSDYAAVMFVSSHAVHFFFRENLTLAKMLKGKSAPLTRAWATGPGTCSALVRWGVPPNLVDTPAPTAGQFDSEALWQVVAPQVVPDVKVLIVRGDTLGAQTAGDVDGQVGIGRDWLAQQLRSAGATVEWLVAYQRGAPVWTDSEVAFATACARDGSVWLFSSAEALQHLGELLPGQDWSRARALVTHPRIAQAACALGFGHIVQTRPTLADVQASLESLA